LSSNSKLCPITNINLRKLKLDDFSSLTTNTRENVFSTSRLLSTAINMTISAGTDSNRGKKNIVKSKNTGRLRKGLTKANIIDQLNLGPISV